MKTKLLFAVLGAVGALAGIQALARLADRFEHQLTDGLGCCGPDEGGATVYQLPQLRITQTDEELGAMVTDWREVLKLDGEEFGR